MIELPFTVRTDDRGARIKQFHPPDKRFGPCIGHEALLWDALQEALGMLEERDKALEQLLAEPTGQKGRRK